MTAHTLVGAEGDDGVMGKKTRLARSDYFSVPQLKDRGWTPAMIRDLLPVEDLERPNPMFKSAAPMRLWLVSRVEATEAGAAFADRRSKAQARGVSATAVANRKRAELAAVVRELVVTVTVMPLATATSQAISAYNRHQRRFDDADDSLIAGHDSDPDFLHRITVNHLRHHHTAYDELWTTLMGRVGRDEAHLLLREKVLNEIATAYPDLAAECARQLRTPNMSLGHRG